MKASPAPLELTPFTPVELWPAMMTIPQVAAVTPLSEASVRDWVRSGKLPKVDLPTDNVLIGKGELLKRLGLFHGIGDAMELSRRQAAVDVAREKVGRISGDLRTAEEELRLAEERLRDFTKTEAA